MKKKTIIAIVTIVIISMIVGIYLMNKTWHTTPELGTKSEMSEAEINDAMKAKADKSILAVSFNREIELKEGGAKAQMDIENLPQNNYDIKVEIRNDENDDLIYQSKTLEPGYIIREDVFDKNLEKGRYRCSATIIAYEDGKEAMRATSALIVKVKK